MKQLYNQIKNHLNELTDISYTTGVESFNYFYTKLTFSWKDYYFSFYEYVLTNGLYYKVFINENCFMDFQYTYLSLFNSNHRYYKKIVKMVTEASILNVFNRKEF